MAHVKEITIGTKIGRSDKGRGDTNAEALKACIDRALSRTSRTHNHVHVHIEQPIGAFQFVRCRGRTRTSSGPVLGGEALDRIVAAVCDWALQSVTERRLSMRAARLAAAGLLDPDATDSFVAHARERLLSHPQSSLPPLPHLRGLLREQFVDALHREPRVVVDGVVRFRCPHVARAVDGAVNQTLDAYRKRIRDSVWTLEPFNGHERAPARRAGAGSPPQRGSAVKRVGLDEDGELLALLRGFAGAHEGGAGEVHVYYRTDRGAGRFVIFDGDGQPVRTEYLEGIPDEWIESEVEYQDLLMSDLISLGPSKIHLHLSPTSEVAADVRRVFGARTTLCGGCDECRADLDEGSETGALGRFRAGPGEEEARSAPDRRGRAGS